MFETSVDENGNYTDILDDSDNEQERVAHAEKLAEEDLTSLESQEG